MSEEQIYVVKGMSCDGCVRSVTNAIQQADGAASVSVDLESGHVSLKSGLNEEAVRTAVEDAGFDFGGRAT
jgi:copper chaperone